jgi:hypothetical protein
MKKKHLIVKYSPGCCDMGDEPAKQARFNTVKELLNIKWVKSFSQDKNFYKFGMSDEHLVATYKKGKEWWVVGYVTYPKQVKLPRIVNFTDIAIFEPESNQK